LIFPSLPRHAKIYSPYSDDLGTVLPIEAEFIFLKTGQGAHYCLDILDIHQFFFFEKTNVRIAFFWSRNTQVAVTTRNDNWMKISLLENHQGKSIIKSKVCQSFWNLSESLEQRDSDENNFFNKKEVSLLYREEAQRK